jgi:hypothetical protein
MRCDKHCGWKGAVKMSVSNIVGGGRGNCSRCEGATKASKDEVNCMDGRCTTSWSHMQVVRKKMKVCHEMYRWAVSSDMKTAESQNAV